MTTNFKVGDILQFSSAQEAYQVLAVRPSVRGEAWGQDLELLKYAYNGAILPEERRRKVGWYPSMLAMVSTPVPNCCIHPIFGATTIEDKFNRFVYNA